MPRRTIHRRRRAQGGCLSFAIGTLAVAALALVVAIMVTNRPVIVAPEHSSSVMAILRSSVLALVNMGR